MDTNSSARFGEILQRYRVEVGLTQEELAERARLSVRAISDLERGVKTRPHLATVRQLAEALGLDDEEREGLQRAARGHVPRAARGHTQPAVRDNAGTADAPEVRTFLIADLRGYTEFTLQHGDEATAGLAGRFAQLVEETMALWDAQAVEIRGDEALVVFSSPRRALQAAVELQRRLREGDHAFPLGVGIGIDAGEAVADRGGYHGAAVNLAARLCSAAQAGEVLSSEGLIHLARKVEGLSYTERGTAQLKGFQEPVRVIQVTASPESAQSPAQGVLPGGEQLLPIGGFLGSLPSGSLVARKHELSLLLSAMESAADGQGRLVLLAGEAGIGKTRLAQELTLMAHSRGFLLGAGRCYEPQQAVPYYPFLDVLGMAYQAAPAGVRDQAAHRWPYLARLLPDQVSATDLPSSDSPEEQDRLFRAVSAFLLALAAVKPVVLLLDDLQWSDSASLLLLHHLARQTRDGRVLLLGTYRDVEVRPDHSLEMTLRDLNREQLMERVVLRRLGMDDTLALIRDTMGPVEAEEELAVLVHRHTDGNPFFTQQVLQALIENGSLYRQGEQWKRRAIQDFQVPESVRSVIAQRVSHLRPASQEVLQEASVLGPAFHFDDLLEMTFQEKSDGDLEEAVDEALADAATYGLVRITGKDRYAFDHALTQQALYATISPRRRRRLHLAAGESMENLPERARTQRAAELAWHFLQGDNEDKSIAYSLLAGDQAESVFAHAEAERHYRAALELAQESNDEDREAEALEKLGVVLKIAGRFEEARDVLGRSATMHARAGNLEAQGRVAAQIGLLYHLSGQTEEGIRRLQALVADLEAQGPSHSLALLYAALVPLYNFVGNQTDQLDATQRLLELAREQTDDRLLAEAEVHRGVALMYLGRYEEALQLLESAIPRAESVGDLHTVCLALDFVSVIYLAWHQVDTARAGRERSVEVAEQLGDPREFTQRALETAYLMLLIGDWTASYTYAERALRSAMEMDNLRAFIQPLYTLGELSLYRGDWEAATGYLRESTTVAQHLGLSDHLREVQALLSERDLIEGNPQAAIERFHSLLDSPGSEEHPTFLLSLAAARVAVGDLHGAQDAVIKAVAVGTQQRLPVVLAEAHRVQGAIAQERGKWAEADTHFEQAITRAREIVYPWGEARARCDRGAMYARRGDLDRAREDLSAAKDIFERLGAEPYRARAEQLIEAMAEARTTSDGATTPPG